MSYLLDTNIVSLIIKRNLEIYQKIEDVKAQRKSIGSSRLCVIIFAYGIVKC
jgi:predicted nucleic acid-binding protein